MSSKWRVLRDAVVDRIVRAGAPEWVDGAFEDLALEVFAAQYEGCAPYRALCDRLGRAPDVVADWEDVPPVPATAFKYFDLVSVPSDPDAVFVTSGTTRGAERRGRHIVPDLDVYRASFRAPFQAALVPDRSRLPLISLIPSPVEQPASSLSAMIGMAADEFATEVVWMVDGAGDWVEGAAAAAAARVDLGEPVLLVGTALAFLHLLESDRAAIPPLPPGSRVMETGGFKGARRDVSRAELYASIAERLRVPEERIVNEYGMTELLSQLYEPVLAEGPAAQGRYVAPPWLRVRVLDPETLAPLPEGRTGVLAFFDLANVGSVSHVLTEDVGWLEDGRLTLAGRAEAAEPRGCSRAMDELMIANRVGE